MRGRLRRRRRIGRGGYGAEAALARRDSERRRACGQVSAELRAAGVRVTVDDSANSLGKKIRNAEVDKVTRHPPRALPPCCGARPGARAASQGRVG